MRAKLQLTLLGLLAFVPFSCVTPQENGDTVAATRGASMSSGQVPGAVTKTAKGPRGLREVHERCPSGAENSVGRPLLPEAEVGAEHPPAGQGGHLGAYARSGCQAH